MISNPHDKFFKETFTRLEVARDFFVNYLPSSVTAVLDLDSLNLQSGSFIDADLQEQFADLLYTVNRTEEGEAYLYILMEHKSYPDPQTPFQLLRYLVRIWERDSREGENLRPIIPIVVYHGRERWRVATDFGQLFAGEEALRPYWPSFHYHLQDLSALSDAEVRGQVQLQIALLVMKYIFDPNLRGRLPEILAMFNELAEAQSPLEYLRTVLYYIGNASQHVAAEEMVEAVQTVFTEQGSDIMGTAADYWIEQGRVETLQDNILDLINIRFDAANEDVIDQISAITDADVLRQLHREAATAVSMEAFMTRLDALASST